MLEVFSLQMRVSYPYEIIYDNHGAIGFARPIGRLDRLHMISSVLHKSDPGDCYRSAQCQTEWRLSIEWRASINT